MTNDTTSSLALLENVDVVIAHSSKEGSAAERCWASTNDSDGLLVGWGKIFRQGWISDLRDTHLFENSNGKFLESVNLDRTLLSLAHIAISCAELTDGAKLTASEA